MSRFATAGSRRTLAERWGVVRLDGVAVPLCLSHRLVAQLVGARRPTVSTAITRLGRDGEVSRLQDGGGLLHGEPVGMPVGEAGRVIRNPSPAVSRTDPRRRRIGLTAQTEPEARKVRETLPR